MVAFVSSLTSLQIWFNHVINVDCLCSPIAHNFKSEETFRHVIISDIHIKYAMLAITTDLYIRLYQGKVDNEGLMKS